MRGLLPFSPFSREAAAYDAVGQAIVFKTMCTIYRSVRFWELRGIHAISSRGGLSVIDAPSDDAAVYDLMVKSVDFSRS